MSTRRSSSRSMMRSSTPWRPPSGLRGSVISSQFLNAARPSSPQNFERALSSASRSSVSVKPRAFQSAARRERYCLMWIAERRREHLLLHGRDVEIRRRLDQPVRERDAIVDRLHRAAAEDFAGRELGRHDRRREFLEERLPVCIEPEQDVGHEDRHERGQRAPEIDFHLLDFGIGLPQRIGRFDQRRAELRAEHRLDLLRDRRRDRLGGLHAGIQHRLAHDADAHAFQRARRARRLRVHRVTACSSTDERGTVVYGSRGS